MKQLPNIHSSFADWYQEVIYQAELVDQSPVRGTMVVRPYGCAMWEQMTKVLDARFKETGHQNALFPLFIPESFLKREADHVAGFAPELAVVTHAGGKELEEPLVVRPTSETIIHYMFARWIKSWRDLPLKINQWANVVRWEMRPRPFIRTTEFYWQEGHTAHATNEEAYEEAVLMLSEYVAFATDYLAIPVLVGRKTEQEKFPGAQITLTFEGIMQDGKALQMGTSHLLSQTFAHAFEMKFQDQNGQIAYPHLTSWGTTTRLIGAVVMMHGDQKGLIIPPFIAPIQIVIIPIVKSNSDNSELMEVVDEIARELADQNIRFFIDADQHKTPGSKFYEWELKGVPLRLEIGARDLANSSVTLVERVDGEKIQVAIDQISTVVPAQLKQIHKKLFNRATQKMDELLSFEEKLETFGPLLEQKTSAYRTSWCTQAVCENRLKEFKATIRCILETERPTFRICFGCNTGSSCDVIVAKAY
jgi:prolyl-tRNA synthetase